MKARRTDFKDLLAWQYHRDIIEPLLLALELATNKDIWPMVKNLPYKLSTDDKTSDSVEMAFKKAWGSFYATTLGSTPRINPMESFTGVQKRLLGQFANTMVRKTISSSKAVLENVGSVNQFALDKALNRRKDQWISENVNLISKIPVDQLQRMQTEVWTSISTGEHVGVTKGNLKGKRGLMADLMESFSISQNKAKLIARDQTLKFMSNLQEDTFNEVGIEYYTWVVSGGIGEGQGTKHTKSGVSNIGDGRVRDTHGAANGLIFKLGEAPSVGSNGDSVEPGQDFQCRCTRIPYMPAFRKEVRMQEGGPLGSYKPVKIKQ